MRPRDKEVELGRGAPALPELEALCGDLTTATNINRAVAQVFLLLAQGRISRRDALAFGSLARLLLRTVPAIRSEFVSAFGYPAWEAELKPKLTIRPDSSSRPSAKVYQQDELSPVNKVNASEGSLSDRRAALAPSAQQDCPSPNVAQRAKNPVAAPPPISQPPAPASPPAAPAPAASVAALPKRPAASWGPLPSRPPEISPEIPARIPDTPAADSVPNKVPSPAASPAGAPVAKAPRLAWVERLQQLIPESSL